MKPRPGLRKVASAMLASLVLPAAFAAFTRPAWSAGTPPASATPSFGHAMIVQQNGEPALRVDGAPFFFWGGAFFYERIPAAQWRASMLAMRALGANTLDLYVPWNWHELADGAFDFDGHTDPRRNLREVLRLGAELGFHFIVRPGPVIRNEWRNGGYPAWLLSRPEYAMPAHDILEGRYPATATLQNAHSDDAAAEWLGNATHVRYAARWLHRALDEFRPYADRVIAVQLDDDQGAYIDNQTYPAPNLVRYLGWLEAQAREVVGPLTPTFINTYQMRAPWAAPVWTMGNWYQSDAYSIGEHDRVELDFSTLLLATNRRGPLAQSEFQAGWLAAAEDPQPRPADPRNTALALDELLALGSKGIVDFPMQDTLAEPGWEAPFSNAFYGWDAALTYDAARDPAGTERTSHSARFTPTQTFGTIVRVLGPVLVRTRRDAGIAVAYGEPPPRADSRPPDGAGAIVARVRASLAQCVRVGVTCDLIDLRHPAHLERYTQIVIVPELAAAAPAAAAALRRSAGGTHIRVSSAIPVAAGPAVTVLRGPLGDVRIATNWSDRPMRAQFGRTIATIEPHGATIRVAHLSLAALGARGDRRQVSSDDCELKAAGNDEGGPADLVFASSKGCTLHTDGGGPARAMRLAANERVDLPSLARHAEGPIRIMRSVMRYHDPFELAPGVWLPLDDGGEPAPGEAVVREHVAIDGLDTRQLVLRNDRLRVIVAPDAGARAFGLQGRGPDGWSPNAFDVTGGWRDDVAAPLGPSPRDYIAPYTHAYPAGTFNRPYQVEILASGPRASVRLSYTMPDAEPANLRFERTVTLAPNAARVVVDERLVAPPGAHGTPAIVVRSSSPALAAHLSESNARDDVPLDDLPRERAATLAAPQTSIATFRSGFAFVVAWPPGDVDRATWAPYRSTGTLALTLHDGPRRVTYAVVAAGDRDAARRAVEAERTWAAANPSPGVR